MKKSFILLAVFLLSNITYSQVVKKVVVEHFTNTRCSTCAFRNPGFYGNYSAQTNVIHLAFHPSSPYSNCVLSQHNSLQNDARTNYYGIYGGTPRLVIQGTVISPSENYASASIFTPYLGQLSPASIKIVQSKYGNDSIRSRIVIKTEASHSLPELSLFVALAEDTLTYTGSNGEPVHYDVFRKSLTETTGISVTLPTTVGDSVVYTMSSTVNGAWNFGRIFTLAILQEAVSKEVVQSESVPASASDVAITTGISNIHSPISNIKVFSVNNTIVVNQYVFSQNTSITIRNLTGEIIRNVILTSNYETISLPNVSSGIYLYTISNESITKTGKLFIQ